MRKERNCHFLPIFKVKLLTLKLKTIRIENNTILIVIIYMLEVIGCICTSARLVDDDMIVNQFKSCNDNFSFNVLIVFKRNLQRD